jgi:predicted transcriptional regulator
MSTVKERLQHILDELPDDVSFEDAVYEMYLQAKISRGLADVAAGRTVSTDEIKRRFRLTR